MTLQIEFIHKPTKTLAMTMIIARASHGEILVGSFNHSENKSKTPETAMVMKIASGTHSLPKKLAIAKELAMIVAGASHGDILVGCFSLSGPELSQEHGLY